MPTTLTSKPFDIKLRGDISAVKNEIIKGRILEAALKDLQGQPGFNPAAISVVFGLKW
jgi:hypothetical protein